MKTVDANFVLRYLLADVQYQYEEAKVAFERDHVYIPFEVLAEVVYVLQSVYHVSESDISQSLSLLLRHPQNSTVACEVAIRALDELTVSSLDFVDALLLGRAVIRGHEILTFDKTLSMKIQQHLR